MPTISYEPRICLLLVGFSMSTRDNFDTLRINNCNKLSSVCSIVSSALEPRLQQTAYSRNIFHKQHADLHRPGFLLTVSMSVSTLEPVCHVIKLDTNNATRILPRRRWRQVRNLYVLNLFPHPQTHFQRNGENKNICYWNVSFVVGNG